jgi:hypothetical protein
MPILRAVLMTRQAISPRLAIRIFSSGVWNSGPDVDVEADVGEGGGDHLGAAVVAVLAHLGDQHARPAALSANASTSRWMRAKPSSPS